MEPIRKGSENQASECTEALHRVAGSAVLTRTELNERMMAVVPQTALDIIGMLDADGHRAHLVGGCVRDVLLGRVPHDWDICSSALPEHVIALFPRTIPTGLRHGTVTIVADDMTIEITSWRTESAYSDRRRPDSVTFTDSLDEDLLRRDFTINAMAWSPTVGLSDPSGGREDLARRMLRCVGDPLRRFDEDALRMMRAIRFCAQLGFSIDASALQAITAHAERISHVSRERILSEFRRTLASPNPDWLDTIWTSGLAANALPFGRPDRRLYRSLRLLRDMTPPTTARPLRSHREPDSQSAFPESLSWAALLFFLPDARGLWKGLPAGRPDFHASKLVEELRLEWKTAEQADRMAALLPFALSPSERNLRHVAAEAEAESPWIFCLAEAVLHAAELPVCPLTFDGNPTRSIPTLPTGGELAQRHGLKGREISECRELLSLMHSERPEVLAPGIRDLIVQELRDLLPNLRSRSGPADNRNR